MILNYTAKGANVGQLKAEIDAATGADVTVTAFGPKVQVQAPDTIDAATVAATVAAHAPKPLAAPPAAAVRLAAALLKLPELSDASKAALRAALPEVKP